MFSQFFASALLELRNETSYPRIRCWPLTEKWIRILFISNKLYELKFSTHPKTWEYFKNVYHISKSFSAKNSYWLWIFKRKITTSQGKIILNIFALEKWGESMSSHCRPFTFDQNMKLSPHNMGLSRPERHPNMKWH